MDSNNKDQAVDLSSSSPKNTHSVIQKTNKPKPDTTSKKPITISEGLNNSPLVSDNNGADSLGFAPSSDKAGMLSQPSAKPNSTHPQQVNIMESNNNDQAIDLSTDTHPDYLTNNIVNLPQSEQPNPDPKTPLNEEQKAACRELWTESYPIPESLESMGKTDFKKLLSQVAKTRKLKEKQANSLLFDSDSMDSEIRDYIINEDLLKNMATEDYAKILYGYDHRGFWLEIPDEALPPKISIILDTTVTNGYNASKLHNVTSLIRQRLNPRPIKKESFIGFKNCVLDVNSRSVIKHSMDHGLSNVADYDYDSKQTECKKFDEWLNYSSTIYSEYESIQGVNDEGKKISAPKIDEEKTKAKKQLIMASLYMVVMNKFDWQMFIDAVGEGGSGKSIFLGICQMLVGIENCCALTLHQLECASPKGGNNLFGLEPIIGKRLITCPDAEKMAGDFNHLKRITGGDPISIPRKHIKNINLPKVEAVVVITENQPMVVTDRSNGIWRRRIILLFNNVVKEGNVDPEFLSKIKQEVAAIFNKVLNEFKTPEEARKILKQAVKSEDKYQITAQADPFLRWVNECLIISEDHEEEMGNYNKALFNSNLTNNDTYRHKISSCQKLYPSYYFYCQHSGIKHTVSLSSFKDALLSLHHKMDKFKGIKEIIYRSNRKKIKGIKLNDASPHLEAFREEIELNTYRLVNNP
jgi:phage/plasmid-associated DNA primase